MHAYTFLIPTTYNNGSQIPHDVIDAVEERMIDTFGGFTHNPTLLRGAWRDDDGRVYRDILTSYTLFSDSPEAIELFAIFVANITAQICLAVIFPDNSSNLIYSNMLVDAA